MAVRVLYARFLYHGNEQTKKSGRYILQLVFLSSFVKPPKCGHKTALPCALHKHGISKLEYFIFISFKKALLSLQLFFSFYFNVGPPFCGPAFTLSHRDLFKKKKVYSVP